MIILSPSILAADFASLGEQMARAEAGGCDYFHFDVMDGMFVPNISFGLPVLSSIRKITKKVLDVHLMIEAPERYVDRFIDAGADIITVHQEACVPLAKTIERIHSRGKRAGIAIKPHTDVEVLGKYLGLADMFLIMTVEPGFGGQEYIDFCTGKIMKLKKMLSDSKIVADIQVDGGITRQNIGTVLSAGANVIVMGSSIFGGNIEENAKHFSDIFAEYE
ncbi:MAG: ribulose-phosphate 3-epimerase [Lachnospiraceae bacterium]|nr:ribulose-phosphate 3-epimerase [Lachnospiraceae bacterium]